MIIDAHVHCSGRETQDDILRSMDAAQIDKLVLLAPFLSDPYSLEDAGSLRAGNDHLAALTAAHADRLIGFAVVNPLHATACDDLDRAAQKPGIAGLKMVPTGWYPYDECAHRVFETAARLGLPCLFHSGIFIDGKSGRFCRPVFFEAVREHPTLRVTLAHLGWPWCDEAIAVGLIDLIKGVDPGNCQIRFDFSFGPPPVYRQEALRRALDVLGAGLIHFGSDRFLPCSGEHLRAARNELEDLLDALNVGEADRQAIFYGNAARWLGLT